MLYFDNNNKKCLKESEKKKEIEKKLKFKKIENFIVVLIFCFNRRNFF